MLAKNVKLNDLKEAHECIEAISAIEHNPKNYVGGFTAWCSGKDCELTAGAKAKIKAIETKLFSFDDGDE